MLKAGVFGAGHLGKIHLKLLKESSKYELVGFYDNNETHAIEVQETFGYKFYSSQDALLNEIDVAVIVTPTLTGVWRVVYPNGSFEVVTVTDGS